MSRPSTPRDLWWVRWYGYKGGQTSQYTFSQCPVEMKQVLTYPERSTVRNANGQVGNNSDQTIGQRALEGKIVRDLVDGQKQVLVRGGAKDVGNGPELQGPEGR